MESAAERKARLKALRAARDDKVGGEKKLKFRNYLPQSEELAPAFEPPPLPELQAPPPPVADEDDGDTPAAPAPAPSAFDAELSRIQADEPEGALNVVPRDPNWDLKRDLEPRAEVLRKRTQKAIVEILRERPEAEAHPEACVVKATERPGSATSAASNSSGDARRLIDEERRRHGVERLPGQERLGRRRKLAVVLAQSIARRRPIPRGHRSVDRADLVARGGIVGGSSRTTGANVIGEGKRQEIYKLRDETHHDDGPGDKPEHMETGSRNCSNGAIARLAWNFTTNANTCSATTMAMIIGGNKAGSSVSGDSSSRWPSMLCGCGWQPGCNV